MRFVRAILTALLVAALAAYSLDCFAASTPDEAMQCCDSMPCPQHDGSQDCCQTMPSLQAPFVQPHSVDTTSHPLVPVALLAAPTVAQSIDSPSQTLLGALCHAPPDIQVAAQTPIRI
jgi:hypothetical protein